jgi:hypothetical protein
MKVHTNLNIRIGILSERNVWEDQINTRFLQGVNQMSTSAEWGGIPNELPRIGNYSRALSRMYDVIEYNIPIDKELEDSITRSNVVTGSPSFAAGFTNILIVNEDHLEYKYNEPFNYNLSKSFSTTQDFAHFGSKKEYKLKYKNTNITCIFDLYCRIAKSTNTFVITVTPVGVLGMKELGGQNIFAPIYGSACVQGNIGRTYFIENQYPFNQPYNTPIASSYINPIISWVYEGEHTINISDGLLEGGTIYKYTGQTTDYDNHLCSFTVYSDDGSWSTAINHTFYGGTITIDNITYSIITMEYSDNYLVFNINGQGLLQTHLPSQTPSLEPIPGTGDQPVAGGYINTTPNDEFTTEHSVPNSEAVTYLGVFGKYCLGEIDNDEKNPYNHIQIPNDFIPQNPLYNSIMPGINMIEGNPGVYANNMDDGEFISENDAITGVQYHSWKSHEKIFPTVFMTQSNGYLGPVNSLQITVRTATDVYGAEYGVYFWPVAASYNTQNSVIDGILTYPYVSTVINHLQGSSLTKKGDVIRLGNNDFNGEPGQGEQHPTDINRIGYHYINGGPLGPCKTMGVVSDVNISVQGISSN